MTLPIPNSCSLTSVGITIFTKVWTRVVLADILTNDATTELSLSFILIVLFPTHIHCIGDFYCPIGNNRSKILSKMRNDFHPKEFHKHRIVICDACYEFFVYTMVWLYVVLFQIDFFCASGKFVFYWIQDCSSPSCTPVYQQN